MRIRSLIWSIGQHWTLVLLASLVVFHALNNWAWLSTNLSILNSDARRHLITSLASSDMLRPVNLSTLFSTVTMDEFRPPLFQLSAVPLLRVLGRSTDVATMVNIAYLSVLLAATYAVGKKTVGADAGLLAAFVISTFPAIYAMSRCFYLDFALTAVVSLNVALLLYSEDFRRKGCTLLYGLTFGMGMLVKWTFVVFALPPIVLVVARSGVLRRLPKAVRAARVEWRLALVSAVLALGLTALWYLPNVDAVRNMFLGLWVLPLCWVILAITFYAVSRPRGQEANLFGASMLALSVASIWYLPRIDFLWEFLLAVGRHSQGAAVVSTGYLRLLVDEQLSAFYVLVLVITLLIVLLANRRRWQRYVVWHVLSTNAAVVGSWSVFSFLVFSFRANDLHLHSRYTMPMLPPLALLIAAGLLATPWRTVKVALVILVAMIGLTQFFALSYDGLAVLRAAAIAELPGGRSYNIFAHGIENQLPNSGVTDGRYWVVPDILEFMREDSSRNGREGAELGILMKTHYVQASTFELVSIEQGYPEMRVRELARAWSDAPVYPQLFELDYLVLKDGSQKGINREETRDAVAALLGGTDAFLQEVFEVARRYPLPDGETIYLYRKKYQLTDYEDDAYRAAAQDVETMASGREAIIFERPGQIEAFARHYEGTGKPYPIPRELPMDQKATMLELEEIAANHDMIFALLWQEEQVDPDHIVEGWLNREGYQALVSWYGPVRLAAYAAPLDKGSHIPSHGVQAHIGRQLRLIGYTLDSTEARPGQILRVSLSWRAEEDLQEDYKVFLHLLDAQDEIVGQHDGAPVGGWMQTSVWPVGETVSDNHGVVVPRGVPSGEYRLVLGMYDPQTGRRLSVLRTGQAAGDSLFLADIVIEEE